MRRALLPALLTLLALPPALHASEPVGTEKRYLACPVYRDTDAGRKSGCWLATDPGSGYRYDLSNSLNKPFAARAVLVEGVVSAEKNVCGAPVLEPVRVTVLPDTCPEVTIPAEGWPSKPSGLPPEVVAPLAVPRKPPPPPYTVRDFHVVFDFGDDFITYQHGDVAVEKIAVYADASRSRRVVVTGHADTRGLVVSGRTLREDPALALRRAREVAEALHRLGVPQGVMEVKAGGQPEPVPSPAGLQAAYLRRVTVTVTPGP